MKCPLSTCPSLLGSDTIEVLLVIVGRREERFQIVLLHFLTNKLLKCLRLEDLVRFLLGSQLDQKRLIDPLQRCHLRVLCWVGRVSGGFELANVGLTLR